MKGKKWEKTAYRSQLGVEMFAWAGTGDSLISLSR